MKEIKLAFLVFLFGSSLYAGTFDGCAEWLTKNQFVRNRSELVDLKLNFDADGKVTYDNSKASLTEGKISDSATKQTILALKPWSSEIKDSKTGQPIKVQVVVLRDIEGRIVSVELWTLGRQEFLGQPPPGFVPTYFQRITTLNFENKNGECTPRDVTDVGDVHRPDLHTVFTYDACKKGHALYLAAPKSQKYEFGSSIKLPPPAPLQAHLVATYSLLGAAAANSVELKNLQAKQRRGAKLTDEDLTKWSAAIGVLEQCWDKLNYNLSYFLERDKAPRAAPTGAQPPAGP